MNKRGDIPLFLVFIGTILLVILALATFATYNGRLERPLDNINSLGNSVEILQDYLVSLSKIGMQEALNSSSQKDPSSSFKDYISKNEIRGINTNYYALVRNGKFSIGANEGNYELKIDNVYVKSEIDSGSLLRTFNITLKFEEKGKVITG